MAGEGESSSIAPHVSCREESGDPGVHIRSHFPGSTGFCKLLTCTQPQPCVCRMEVTIPNSLEVCSQMRWREWKCLPQHQPPVPGPELTGFKVLHGDSRSKCFPICGAAGTITLVSMRMRVPSLASLSGSGIWRGCGCGLGRQL